MEVGAGRSLFSAIIASHEIENLELHATDPYPQSSWVEKMDGPASVLLYTPTILATNWPKMPTPSERDWLFETLQNFIKNKQGNTVFYFCES